MSNDKSSPELPRATVSNATRPGHKPHRRRLSNYLLNKSLQLRYVAFVTLLSAALSGVLGYLIWQQESSTSSQILQSVESLCDDPSSAECAELKAALGADLSQRDTSLLLRMAGIGVAMVVLLVLYLIIMTHKVAGPLYKVSRYFERMAEGKMGETYPLRKGDMLTDFYDKFKAMHDEVRGRHQRENELLGRFLQACEDAGVERKDELGARLDQLEAHYEERKQALA